MYLGFVLAALLTTEVLFRVPLQARLSSILLNSSKARHVVQSAKISDHWKEKVLLRYSGAIFQSSLAIAFMMLIVTLPVLVVEIVLRSFGNDGILEYLTQWRGILLFSLIVVAWGVLRGVLRGIGLRFLTAYAA
ncbi:hypothetical protein GC197_10900 [bacterium]|nr:hypothetical protein [bacterium]